MTREVAAELEKPLRFPGGLIDEATNETVGAGMITRGS